MKQNKESPNEITIAGATFQIPKIKVWPSVIDESLLPPPQLLPWETRKMFAQTANYEAWAWFQAFFGWIPGRVGWIIRQFIYRPFFRRAGKGWHIGEFASIQRVQNFQIGHKVAVGRYCVINAAGGVILGDYSGIGPFVQIITAGHNFFKKKIVGDVPYGAQPRVMETAPVILEENAWVGAGAILMPGIRVGSNSVVGAGAVVTKDVPPCSMVAGVPAKVIWQTDESGLESTPGPFILTSIVGKFLE